MSRPAAASPSTPIAGAPGPKPRITKASGTGEAYVDWKDVENLRRMMSPNGKILTRKRLGASAREQRMISQAIKRARFMALLPYTSATL
ncbi:MAG: 30S ribosomal protein S18 [Planctomycetes bacterium]|nr:30S ribosomal protein S18 [Planctomycetota bacterium]